MITWPPRLLRNQPPERGGIRRLAFEHVFFVDAHSRLSRHQKGCGFQLNADVTGKLCWKSIDLTAFSVTSIPKHNKTLYVCIILSTMESEQVFTVVYNELSKAVCLVPSIKPCKDEDCVSC
jgi:hypothetical protein